MAVRLSGTGGVRAALTAAALAMLLGVLLRPNITSWMHNLLADSVRHAPPEGVVCDYGVVLGYALHSNGSCTRPLQSRVQLGVQLFQAGAVRRLLFSGAHPGSGVRGASEAGAMATYAAALLPGGAPQSSDASWLLEEESTSTRTNALRSLETIAAAEGSALAQQRQQPLRLLLITNPFHQRRSRAVFARAAAEAGLQLQLYVAQAPYAPHAGYGHAVLDAAVDQLDFWRELAALAWYAAHGWL